MTVGKMQGGACHVTRGHDVACGGKVRCREVLVMLHS